MKQRQSPKSRKTSEASSLTFAYAIRSFVGYLEGTEKAHHTIKNYRLDLLAFQQYLQKSKSLQEIEAADLDRYHDYLRTQGLKTNTRRRKLMTLRRFLSYLAVRKKLPMDLGKTVLTPYKLERIPVTVPAKELLEAIRALPGETELEQRNRVLFRVLLETGCLVSEASKLRWADFEPGKAGSPVVEFSGKSPRRVAISPELYDWVQEIREMRKASGRAELSWIFLGFNKFGSLGEFISPRGIEMLVKAYAPRLGFPDLVPRTFRHSAVLSWLEHGISESDIQQRLGLKSDYAFRAYAAARGVAQAAAKK